jgi:protoporphyrinogen oxidase
MQGSEHIVVIGGGYTGMVAAYELSKKGKKVTIIEKEEELGGLARSFDVGGGVQLERFYHHWFTNDKYIIELIKELGLSNNIIWNETNTGLYFANNLYKLSSPLDLLKFSALSFIDRIRLGLLTVKARYIKDWKKLEAHTAEDWLIDSAGRKVYEIVWEPLLKGKFGEYKDKVSAVWIWNKLKLRGGSRNKKGGESLAYYKGGFAALTGAIRKTLELNGVKIIKQTAIKSLAHDGNKISGIVTTDDRVIKCSAVISTVALPILSEIFNNSDFILNRSVEKYQKQISDIKYIGNVCLVLVMTKSLSSTYWTNVNDPDFPFVAVIEHTNFEPSKTYQGKHIVYLSKYLPVSDALFSMTEKELMDYSIPYIEKMFPEFSKKWLEDIYIWKESYSQPIVTKNYSQKIPLHNSPIQGLFVSCMAQIYPEDRGTNYAVKYGKIVANMVLKDAK